MVLVNLIFRGLAAWFPPPRSTGAAGPPQAPPIDFPLLVYAHRGGNREHSPSSGCPLLENTLPAFRRSAALGADLLELDVQLTRDGRAAVFHDADLGRMCGPAFRGKRVADFDYSALPPLLPAAQLPAGPHQLAPDAVAPTSTAAGTAATDSSTPLAAAPTPEPDPDGRRIPLLDEVMAAFPGVPLQIDVKVRSPRLVAVVAQLVAAHRREGTILWGSFLHSTSTALYAANPRVPLFASAPRGLMLLAAFCAGSLHRVHVYERAVIMPWATLKRIAKWHSSLVLANFFSALHVRGVKSVLFGDLNDETAFSECMAAGCSAICTDHPSRLMRWLAARKEAKEE